MASPEVWQIQSQMEIRLAELRSTRWRLRDRHVTDGGDTWVEPNTEVRPIGYTYRWHLTLGFATTVTVRPVDGSPLDTVTLQPGDLQEID